MAGASLLMQDIDVTIDNGLRSIWSLDQVSAGSKRFPTALTLGPEMVTGSCTVLTDHGYLVASDELETVNISTTFLNAANPVSTITLGIVAAKVVSVSEPFVTQENDIAFNMDFELDDNSGGLTFSIA